VPGIGPEPLIHDATHLDIKGSWGLPPAFLKKTRR
jgi:hypothetical protein